MWWRWQARREPKGCPTRQVADAQDPSRGRNAEAPPPNEIMQDIQTLKDSVGKLRERQKERSYECTDLTQTLPAREFRFFSRSAHYPRNQIATPGLRLAERRQFTEFDGPASTCFSLQVLVPNPCSSISLVSWALRNGTDQVDDAFPVSLLFRVLCSSPQSRPPCRARPGRLHRRC
jgi:hypothetical protein